MAKKKNKKKKVKVKVVKGQLGKKKETGTSISFTT
mgnify:CR=1 FL=1